MRRRQGGEEEVREEEEVRMCEVEVCVCDGGACEEGVCGERCVCLGVRSKGVSRCEREVSGDR